MSEELAATDRAQAAHRAGKPNGDASLARAELDWSPQTALTHGIEATYAYFARPQ